MSEIWKKEIPRIVIQLVYWIAMGLIAWAAIAHGMFAPQVQTEGSSVACFIGERVNPWVILLDFLLLALFLGFATLLSSRRIIKLLREEVVRSVYALGAFSGTLQMVLHVYYDTYFPGVGYALWLDSVFAILLWLVPTALGLLIVAAEQRTASKES